MVGAEKFWNVLDLCQLFYDLDTDGKEGGMEVLIKEVICRNARLILTIGLARRSSVLSSQRLWFRGGVDCMIVF